MIQQKHLFWYYWLTYFIMLASICLVTIWQDEFFPWAQSWDEFRHPLALILYLMLTTLAAGWFARILLARKRYFRLLCFALALANFLLWPIALRLS